jgi:hypothetical protein
MYVCVRAEKGVSWLKRKLRSVQRQSNNDQRRLSQTETLFRLLASSAIMQRGFRVLAAGAAVAGSVAVYSSRVARPQPLVAQPAVTYSTRAPVSRGWRRYHLRTREDCVRLDHEEFDLFPGTSTLAKVGNWLIPSNLTPWTERWDKRGGSVEMWLQHDAHGNCTMQRTTVRGDGLVSDHYKPRSHADKGKHNSCHLPNSEHGQVVDGVLFLHDGIPGVSDDSGAPPPSPDPFLLNPRLKRFHREDGTNLSHREWQEHAPGGQCCKMSAIVNHADGRVLEFGHASGGQLACHESALHGCLLDGHFYHE